MNKWTPGPWHWVDSLSDGPWNGQSFLNDASLRTVAEYGKDETRVVNGNTYTGFRLPKFILDVEAIGGDEEKNVNARLIAAAAEMAELLAAIVDNRGQCFIPNDKDGLWGWDGKASALLARIKGEA